MKNFHICINRVREGSSRIASRVAVATSAVAFSGAAFAGDLSDAVQSGVDTTELTAIGVIVLTVAGIILLIRSGKKAAN